MRKEVVDQIHTEAYLAQVDLDLQKIERNSYNPEFFEACMVEMRGKYHLLFKESTLAQSELQMLSLLRVYFT